MKTNIFKATLSIVISIILTSNALAQEEITSQQWQSDLDYLQEQVHSEYPFLFKKITQKAWDTQVENLRAEIPTLSEHEIEVGLTRMVSAFAYGHTQIPFSTLAK
ncbi:MAG: hypothetical protein AAFY00_12320, partial [Bacteroidota bacterium]